jgi:hypothetical protein
MNSYSILHFLDRPFKERLFYISWSSLYSASILRLIKVKSGVPSARAGNKLVLQRPRRQLNFSKFTFCRDNQTIFKGTVARDFRPWFFYQSTPPRDPLIHGLKPFCMLPNIHQKNRQFSNFRGVIDLAETPGIFHRKFLLRNYEIVK